MRKSWQPMFILGLVSLFIRSTCAGVTHQATISPWARGPCTTEARCFCTPCPDVMCYFHSAAVLMLTYTSPQMSASPAAVAPQTAAHAQTVQPPAACLSATASATPGIRVQCTTSTPERNSSSSSNRVREGMLADFG